MPKITQFLALLRTAWASPRRCAPCEGKVVLDALIGKIFYSFSTVPNITELLVFGAVNRM